MSRAKIHIEKSGIFSCIVGPKKYDQMEFGVPLGGAMDLASARLANQLLGKQLDDRLFEFTLIGPRLRFEYNYQCVLSGAEMNARLNERVIERFVVFEVKAGDVLELTQASEGFRSYLAISAELPTEEGSSMAKRLNKGDYLEVTTVSNLTPKSVPLTQPDLSEDLEIIPGPEFQALSAEQCEKLESMEMKVEASSNRMAYVFHTDFQMESTDFPSSAILPGTVQLTPSGQLNVMMRDAQTTGGYPRVGVLTEKSIHRLAQKRPGEKVRFTFLPSPAGI